MEQLEQQQKRAKGALLWIMLLLLLRMVLEAGVLEVVVMVRRRLRLCHDTMRDERHVTGETTDETDMRDGGHGAWREG